MMNAYVAGLFVLAGLLAVSSRLGEVAAALRDIANRR